MCVLVGDFSDEEVRSVGHIDIAGAEQDLLTAGADCYVTLVLCL